MGARSSRPHAFAPYYTKESAASDPVWWYHIKNGQEEQR
jgi:hypothetical protein